MDPEQEWPVLILDVTEEESDQILATFDPLSAMAEIDGQKLQELLNSIVVPSSDFQAMIDDLERQSKLAMPAEPKTDEDAEPRITEGDRLQKEWGVEPGQVWSIGDHRLLCGDSTISESVDALFQGQVANAVITDPPYGVEYHGRTADYLPVHNDGPDTLRPLLEAALGNACRICRPGGIWYLTVPSRPLFLVFALVLSELQIWRQTLVWIKETMVVARSDYHYQHESIIYGWKPGAAHQPPPDRSQSSLWHIDRPLTSIEHPTMKPVALFTKMIANSTNVGDLIYEPFAGSGTTLIAAHQLRRRCYAIEISPQYVAVILQRFRDATGITATLDRSIETTETADP